MKLSLLWIAPAALLLPQDREGAQVGDVVDYSFRTAPIGRAGVTSMQDLRGKPVLIDFWGTR